MYGLVNKAIEELVLANHGVEAWDQISKKAGVHGEIFISNEAYPDEITYRLVTEASGYLKVPAEAILFSFGEWWVLETAQKSYGPMMAMAGRTLREFLIHLPNFHTRVKMMYPKLNPPTFRCTEIMENSLCMHYISDRPGLSPFVKGLLSGLGKMFNTPVNVEHISQKDAGADHDVFKVQWS